MRIGLLLPSSNYIARLAKDIRQSILFALGETGATDFEIVVETSSYNEQASNVREKIQDLTIKGDVDVIIAPLNPGMIKNISDLLSAQEVPLIAISMGEDVVDGEIAPPWVFHNSMNLWRSTWLSGYHSVKAYGPKASVILGAHESGYDLVNAAQLGIEAAGGVVASVFPCPLDVDAQSARDRFDWALEDEPDFEVVLGSGEVSRYFSDAITDMHKKAAIIGLAPIEYESEKVPDSFWRFANACCSTWNPKSEPSKNFVELFMEQFGKPAHVYGLLAFEAGHLLGIALQNLSGPVTGKRLCAALMGAEFEGPRGMIRFDPVAQEVIAQQFQLTFAENSSDISVEEVHVPVELTETVSHWREHSDKRGWLNPYLIA